MTRKVRSKRNNHIYRDGAEAKELKAFEKKYGKKGKYVYGATIGKLTREKKRRKKWQGELERTEINQIYKSQMI